MRRYKGLAWARQNDELVLVGEPPSEGTKYVGTRLRPANDIQNQAEKNTETRDR